MTDKIDSLTFFFKITTLSLKNSALLNLFVNSPLLILIDNERFF